MTDMQFTELIAVICTISIFMVDSTVGQTCVAFIAFIYWIQNFMHYKIKRMKKKADNLEKQKGASYDSSAK